VSAAVTDKHHVRILPESVSQRRAKRFRVTSDFPLRNYGPLIAVNIFDRIFDCEEVKRGGAVDFLNHGRQGSRLARAGGTGDNNQPSPFARQVPDNLGKIELFKTRYLGIDRSDGNAGSAALPEHIDTKPAQLGHRERQIHFIFTTESFELLFAQDLTDDLVHNLNGHRFGSDLLQSAIDPQVRSDTNANMQIRSPAVEHFNQHLL